MEYYKQSCTEFDFSNHRQFIFRLQEKYGKKIKAMLGMPCWGREVYFWRAFLVNKVPVHEHFGLLWHICLLTFFVILVRRVEVERHMLLDPTSNTAYLLWRTRFWRSKLKLKTRASVEGNSWKFLLFRVIEHENSVRLFLPRLYAFSSFSRAPTFKGVFFLSFAVFWISKPVDFVRKSLHGRKE